MRLGFVSCANLQAGWFSAYRHLAARNDLHAVIHLGDYFYESATSGMGKDDVTVRPHAPAHELLSLPDYRVRHAQYKQDRDLQDLHAAYPMIVTWDDHEVADDAWRGGAGNHTGLAAELPLQKGTHPAGGTAGVSHHASFLTRAGTGRLEAAPRPV